MTAPDLPATTQKPDTRGLAMTATVTSPPAMLHASGERVRDLFAAVLAHTATDDPDDYTPPHLTHVHIDVRRGELRLIGTDNFSMGIVREPLTHVADGFTASFAVPAENVRRILTDAFDEPVGLAIERNRLRLLVGEDTHELTGERSAVPWRGVLARHLAPTPNPPGMFALDPTLLARFRAAKPLAEDEPMLFRLTGERGIFAATLGTVFLGMATPRDLKYARRIVPERPLDPWFDIADEADDRA